MATPSRRGRLLRGVAGIPTAYAILLAAGALVAASFIPVPYVAVTPGPTVNTVGSLDGSPVLTISGAKTYPSDGELLFTTVAVYSNQSLGQAVSAWFSRAEAIVPRTAIYPAGRTKRQTEAANRQDFDESESRATAAALRYLGYPTEVAVVEVSPDGPSSGILQPGDLVTSVDGRDVTTSAQVIAVVSKVEPGTAVDIGYTRAGKPATASIVTEPSSADPDASVIGVTIREQATDGVTVDISAKGVGGPSAGMMMAVGIIDLMTPEDLSGGSTVAGTGTITAEGKVGPIGGIEQKVVAAYDAGARQFLLPNANCAAAVGNAPDGLRLVPVRTLSDSVGVLKGLAAAKGGVPSDLPSCAGA